MYDVRADRDYLISYQQIAKKAADMGKTGVEMEALTGVSVALLTIYDMCKALDKSMEIGEIYLCRKTGGKSGEIQNENHQSTTQKAKELHLW